MSDLYINCEQPTEDVKEIMQLSSDLLFSEIFSISPTATNEAINSLEEYLELYSEFFGTFDLFKGRVLPSTKTLKRLMTIFRIDVSKNEEWAKVYNFVSMYERYALQLEITFKRKKEEEQLEQLMAEAKLRKSNEDK